MRDLTQLAIQKALEPVRASRSLQAAISYLQTVKDEINHNIGKAVLADIPAFSESRNPDVIPELAHHATQHTDELLRLLNDSEPGDFSFVSQHARLRADQHFPLEYTLHAYRVGHKFYSRLLRETVINHMAPNESLQHILTAVAEFSLEYTDAISTIAASAYAEQTRLNADIAVDRRVQLMNLLLEGHDESDQRVTQLLKAAGFSDDNQTFCVALAQSADPAEMALPARARRMATYIDGLFAETRLRRLIDVRDHKITMIFAQPRRQSGWTSPTTSLAELTSRTLKQVGISAVIGVSNDAPSTSHIPPAYQEAELALQLASVQQPVCLFHQIPLDNILLYFAGDAFRKALPHWSDTFFTADDRPHGSQPAGRLTETIHAYAGADMNVLKTAETLGLHANTLYARFDKITELTGLNPRRFHDLTTLLLVIKSR